MKKLYIVSLGPGDPELLTLKAYKTIKNAKCICVPTKRKDSFAKSKAYEIIRQAFIDEPLESEIVPIYTPMKLIDADWQNQVDIIMGALLKYGSIAYLTIGDAAIYSTAYYLLNIIAKQNVQIFQNCEVIPGITSFSLASSKVKQPLCLGEESLTLMPCKPKKELQNTTVYMRPESNMRTNELPLSNNTVLFQNLSCENELITNDLPDKIEQYMTLLIDFPNR